MKILIVIDAIEVGGATTYVALLAAALQQKGHRVRVLGGTSGARKEAVTQFHSIESTTYMISGKSMFHLQFSIIWKTYQLLQGVISSFQPDVIYTNTSLSAFAVAISPCCLRIPIVNHFHGAWYQEIAYAFNYFEQSVHRRRFRWFVRHSIFFAKQTLRYFVQWVATARARIVTTYTPYAATVVQHAFHISKQRIILVQTAVLRPHIRRVKKTIRTPVFTIMARPDPRKGIHLALQAFRLVYDQGVRATLIIGLTDCGGPYYNKLCELKQSLSPVGYEDALYWGSHVVFKHTASQKEKNSVLSNTDYFLMLSPTLETLGYTTLECLSVGIPVIGVASGGTKHILSRMHLNTLLTTASPTAIAHTMRRILALPPSRVQQLQQTCQLVTTRYSTQTMTEDIKRVLHIIAKNRAVV